MELKPLHDNIVIILDEKVSKTQGGIFLASNNEKQPQSGKVIAVGPKVSDIKIGDHIGFETGQFRKMSVDDKVVAIVKEKDVTGVFEE